MIEVRMKNPSDTDKIISIVRNPIRYTVPAKGETTIILEDPEKDIIVLES